VDTKTFLDNLTSEATKSVFSSFLSVSLSAAEFEKVQKTFGEDSLFHTILEDGSLHFRHNNAEYVLIPEVIEPVIAEATAEEPAEAKEAPKAEPKPKSRKKQS
jgi:hypothetical protein